MKTIVVVLAFVAIATAPAQQARPKIRGPLSIAEAIRFAEQNNPSLAIARSQLAVGSAGVRFARSFLWPQLSANSFATTGSYTTIISSSPGVTPSYSLLVPSRGFLDQNLMLMAPLFTGGRLQAMVGSANSQRRAAEGDLAEMRGDVVLRVRDAYLKALVAKQLVLVQEARVAAAEELLRTTQAQFEAGRGIEASVQRVRAELSRGQRSLTSARNDVAKALLDLIAAIGADFDSSISLTDELVLQPETDSLEGDVEAVRSTRGRLLAARARADAAVADVHAARAQRSPQIYGQAMGDVASLPMGNGATVGLTLSLPIFDGGRIDSEVAAAKAKRSAAQAEVTNVLIAVENEVRQAWLDVQTSKANAASAEASLKAAQSGYDVVSLRFSSGRGILVEELDALQALTEAKADLAQAIYDQNIAIARLARASGRAN